MNICKKKNIARKTCILKNIFSIFHNTECKDSTHVCKKVRDTATNVKASWPILKYILITQKLFMFVIDFKEKTEFFDYSFANQCSIIKNPNYFFPAASKSKLSFICHSQQMKIL